MKTKNIDWYGNEANYIHLKFGNARKNYNFTADFIGKYPNFAREYANYFENRESKFGNPFAPAPKAPGKNMLPKLNKLFNKPPCC